MFSAAAAMTPVATQWGAAAGIPGARQAKAASFSRPVRARPGEVVCGKAAKEAKKAAKLAEKANKKANKAPPEMSKAAKDKLRKKEATERREQVSRQGKLYDAIAREMGKDQCREYVLSIKHSPPEGVEQKAMLSDWLPIAEVVIVDKVQYEAQLFFKKNEMDIPETELTQQQAAQFDGVPAMRAVLPSMGAEILAMAVTMAGPVLKDVNTEELEYGIEDWGSFEHAVEALRAMSNQKGLYAAAAKTLGVDAEDAPADIKRVYRRLIAEAHPDRNPDAGVERFNAIKDAYELLSGRGGSAGNTFDNLGDKAKRDFTPLDNAHFGVSGEVDASKVQVAMRTLTVYDNAIGKVFNARNMGLDSRQASAAPKVSVVNVPPPPGGAAAAAEESAAEGEPVAV